MDLQLYARVLWRFKLVVSAGLVLALALALLSFMRFSLEGGRPTFAYRDAEEWQSRSVLFITQHGFPWGRSVPKYTEADPEAGVPAVPLGDQGRLAGLALIYSQLANSDAVRKELAVHERVRGTVEAKPITDQNGATLPLMAITATSFSAQHAVVLARRATAVFRRFVERQQREAAIAPHERIVLDVLADGERPILYAPRKKTVPFFVFMAVMTAVIGLVLVFENLRPLPFRATGEPLTAPAEESRRTA